MLLESEFEHDMYEIYQNVKEANYIPNIFKIMLDQHGGVETAKRLLATNKVQDGLDRLWQMGNAG